MLCVVTLNVILNVIILSVVLRIDILNVTIQSVVPLNVAAPKKKKRFETLR